MLKTCYGAIGISGAFWSEREDPSFMVPIAGFLSYMMGFYRVSTVCLVLRIQPNP